MCIKNAVIIALCSFLKISYYLLPPSSGLEAFIRAKYEQKKYIAAEWVPPKIKVCNCCISLSF
jgi:hypothetical protein